MQTNVVRTFPDKDKAYDYVNALLAKYPKSRVAILNMRVMPNPSGSGYVVVKPSSSQSPKAKKMQKNSRGYSRKNSRKKMAAVRRRAYSAGKSKGMQNGALITGAIALFLAPNILSSLTSKLSGQ